MKKNYFLKIKMENIRVEYLIKKVEEDFLTNPGVDVIFDFYSNAAHYFKFKMFNTGSLGYNSVDYDDEKTYNIITHYSEGSYHCYTFEEMRIKLDQFVNALETILLIN